MADSSRSAEDRGWQPAPLHPREEERLASLREYGLLDTAPEPAFDRVATLAKRLLDVPIALVALLDEERMFCKSHVGMIECKIERGESLCGYAILQTEPLLIPDVQADPKYRNSPAVQRYGIRFYMGVALLDDDGLPIGTLCLIDTAPRTPTPEWIASAVDFAAVVRDEMTLSRSHRKIRESVVELERSERRYTNLVSTVPGVVYRLIMTPDGELRYTFVSEGIRELSGLDSEEYLKLSAAGGTMIHPEDSPLLNAQIQHSARTLEPIQWQGRMLSRQGASRWIQTTARPEVLEDGTIKWAGIATDISALKAAESEIREMNGTLEAKVFERTEDLHRAQIEMLARLGMAAEARDDDTGAHIARVARTCRILAREAGMTAEDCEMIEQAAPMHDIGKISVPDAVLLKPGRLDEEELETMRRHAAEGARMLEGGTTALIQMAETIARSHHERWNGTGYPAGLAGEKIPLVGRIVAIADVFDALTSERPYKRAWSVEQAAAEIHRGAGQHFDPVLVGLFEAALPEIVAQSEELQFPRAA